MDALNAGISALFAADAQFVAALGDASVNAVWNGAADDGTALPLVTFRTFHASPARTMGGGAPAHETYRLTFTAHAEDTSLAAGAATAALLIDHVKRVADSGARDSQNNPVPLSVSGKTVMSCEWVSELPDEEVAGPAGPKEFTSAVIVEIMLS